MNFPYSASGTRNQCASAGNAPVLTSSAACFSASTHTGQRCTYLLEYFVWSVF